MTEPGITDPTLELHRQRAAVHRGLRRVNTATMAMLAVVLGLAATGVFQAFRAHQSATESAAATLRARDELWKSYQAKARASRLSGRAGRKHESLSTLAAAARIRQSPQLRDEAIACLALTDLRAEAPWLPFPEGNQSVAMSPDLSLVAMGSTHGEISLRRMATGAEVARLKGADFPVDGMRFSHDGRLLAAQAANGEVTVREWGKNRLILRVAGVASGWAGSVMDFNGDDTLMVVGTRDGTVAVHDLVRGGVRWQHRLDPVPLGVSFAPSGTRFAVSRLGIEVWDFATGTRQAAMAYEGEVGCMAWHPAGNRVAAGASDGNVLLWDLPDGRRHMLPGHLGVVSGLMFNHRGDWLVSHAWDGTTRLWDVGLARQQFSTRSGYALGFSPDDRHLAYQKERLGVGTWEFDVGAALRRLTAGTGGSRDTRSLQWIANGQFLLTSHADGLRLWSMPGGRVVAHEPPGPVWAAAWHEGRRSVFVASNDGIQEVPMVAEKAPIAFGSVRPLRNGIGTISGLALSPDRGWLAAAGGAGAWLFDLADPTRDIRLGTNGNFTSVEWSSDKRWVVTGTWRGEGVQVWDGATGAFVKRLDPHDAEVHFSPDGRWLLTGSGLEYVLWNPATWEPVHRLVRHRANPVPGPGNFSADSGMVALTLDAGEISLVGTGDGKVLARLTAPEAYDFHVLRFSLDGGRVFAGTESEVVQMWDLGALRGQLEALGIAWKPSITAPSPGDLGWAPVAGGGAGRLIVWTACCVVLAFLFGVFVVHRHRSLFASYIRIDELNFEHQRQLEVAQAEILHSQKMKALGALAAGIAHDFNNLLSVIRLSNKLVARAAPQNPEVLENVSEIELAVKQGKGLVRSMVGYSRGSGEGSAPFAVPEMVEDSVALLSKEFLGGLVLTLELDRNTPPVTVNRGRLEQVLLNLLVNAAEAMLGQGQLRLGVRALDASPEGGVLRARPAPGYVELTVADAGPGIDPQLLSRIFEPFFSTKMSGLQRGAGLGLSMVYTIAEQDGLGVIVETQRGQGTTFRIVVPAGKR